MTNSNWNDQQIREILNRNVVSKLSGVEKRLIEFQENFQKTSQHILDDVTHFLTSIEDEALHDLREEFSQFARKLRSQVETDLRPVIKTDLEAQLRPQLDSEIRGQLEEVFETRFVEAKQTAFHSVETQLISKLDGIQLAIQEISQQGSQVNILSSFINHAALFAARVAFFIVKSEIAIGWKACGFEGEFKNENIKNLNFPIAKNELLQQICLTQQPFGGSILTHSAVSALINNFGHIAPDYIYLLPIAVRNKVVAILYADSGLLPNQPVDTRSLSILTAIVGQTVELGSTRAKLGIKPPVAEVPAPPFRPVVVPSPLTPPPAAPEMADAPAHPAEEPPSPEPHSVPAVAVAEPPMAPPVQEVAPEPVPLETYKEVVMPPEPEPVTPPVMEAPPAPPVVEPPPTPPVVETPPAPPEPAAVPSSIPAGPIITPEMDDMERKLHGDAYRFAKLLVTEIKLYNENKVVEGRRSHNLYELLRDDIDRSREMYEKRVNPFVSKRTDYFFNELVRVLANNQPEALGKEAPGPNLLQ